MSVQHKVKQLVCFLSIFMVILSTAAQAEMNEPWWEWGIVENSSFSYQDYAAQLSVNVSDAGTFVENGDLYHQALFTFSNDGPYESSITKIYFEDGSLLGLAEVQYLDDMAIDSTESGLDFDRVSDKNPPKLPGWSTVDPKFYTTSLFSVNTNNGSNDGINPGESLGLLYTLQLDKTFDDVMDALFLGMTTPDTTIPRDSLRIGLHIQDVGMDGEYSDTLILTPIPPSVMLGMLGMGIAGLKLRKYA